MKRAYRLWKQYKTDTREYRELAARRGISTADLNAKCWAINHNQTRGAGRCEANCTA
jgi:hypothetical protein